MFRGNLPPQKCTILTLFTLTPSQSEATEFIAFRCVGSVPSFSELCYKCIICEILLFFNLWLLLILHLKTTLLLESRLKLELESEDTIDHAVHATLVFAFDQNLVLGLELDLDLIVLVRSPSDLI